MTPVIVLPLSVTLEAVRTVDAPLVTDKGEAVKPPITGLPVGVVVTLKAMDVAEVTPLPEATSV